MAEQNNDNLSMEDILSSIKDILTEDEGTQTAAAPTMSAPEPAPEPEPVVEIVVPVEEPEDILDLSPSMRIEDDFASAAEINLDAVLGDMNTSLDDFAVAPAPMTEETSVSAADTFFSPEDILADLPSVDETDAFDADSFVAETTDPFTHEANPFNVTAPAAPAVDNWSWDDETPAAEPVAVTEVVEEEQSWQDESDPFIQPSPIAEPAPIFAPEPEVEFEPVLEPEPVFEVAVAAPAPAAESAVDVSASIINNFAKMFSQEAPAPAIEPVFEPVQEPVSELGNAGRTIEDVVSGVIQRIIGDEVAHNWRQGADYDALARAEIKAQTSAWLDKNLPLLVEKIVKSEIERVMAKVGS